MVHRSGLAGEELITKSSVFLKGNFNGCTDAACNLMLHEGRCLRQRLMDGMMTRNRNASAARLSSSRCVELRDVYHKSEVDATDPFLAHDGTGGPRDSWRLLPWPSPNTKMRNKAPLAAWLNSVTAVTNRSYCGLSRHMTGVRASVSPSSMNLALGFLRFVSKLGMKLLFPETWKRGLREWADETFWCSLTNMKR